jgi:hypothetical protein
MLVGIFMVYMSLKPLVWLISMLKGPSDMVLYVPELDTEAGPRN